MNWKLLAIALSLIVVSISARPADETQTAVAAALSAESTTAKEVIEEVTNLTEKPTTLSQPQPTKPAIEATTKKVIATEAATAAASATSTTAANVPTTTRYLQPSQSSLQSTKSTNAHKKKYANNYSNLITKHTLLNNKRFVNNTAAPNITVDNHEFVISSSGGGGSKNANKISLRNNNLSPKTTAASNEVPSLPSFATISSAVNSNSSSKPLLFIDSDEFPITANVDPTTSTTKRAFIALNNRPAGSWPTFNGFDETKATPVTVRKKPVIHKIISKWSDNPNEVFNFHGDGPLISSQHAHINELKNQLVQSAFNQQNAVLSFDNLPTIIGQQLIHQQQHMPTFAPSAAPAPSPTPSTSASPPKVSDLILLKKKPISNNIDEEVLDRCREVRIKLGTKINGKIDSEEMGQCKGLNIHIDNKIDNKNYQPAVTTNDYDIPINDKYEDPPTEELYDSNFIEVDSEAVGNYLARPGATKDDEEKHKKKKNKAKKNKKKQGDITESQIEEESETEEEETTTTTTSMMMTVVTMMAIFNPLNFGVWGLLLAPVAAMTLGGIVFAMYHLTNAQNKHQTQAPVWQVSAPAPWPKPQEIIVKNKINHSPIPIKITHLHKHTSSPQKVVYSHHAPPAQHQPVVEYAPPWHSAPSPVKNSYGEPPADSYYPSAASGDGPYRRKTFTQKRHPQKRQKIRRPSSPFRYKLL